jgi:hypothetical protein
MQLQRTSGHVACWDAGELHASKISRDPRQIMMFLFNCGNYSQKHLRDAATAESKKTLSTSKSFTRVPVPFCNERNLRKKLSCALYWHQDLVRAMLFAARAKPVYAPLVRSHLRGVRYGISRQVQHYLEKLSDLCSKPTVQTLACGTQPVTIDGLYKWCQTYCKAWMIGFEVHLPSSGHKHDRSPPCVLAGVTHVAGLDPVCLAGASHAVTTTANQLQHAYRSLQAQYAQGAGEARVQVVEAEFADILDPAMCAASAWVARAGPTETARMHALETVEASIARDSFAETGADAVRTGMASKPVSVS